MEQYVRDARIAQIYEGTNGVQAPDLVTRKIGLDGGALVRRFFALVRADLATGEPAAGAALTAPVAEALARLESATARLEGASPPEADAAATDYLRLFALVAFGWMWVRMAAAAAPLGDGVIRRRSRGSSSSACCRRLPPFTKPSAGASLTPLTSPTDPDRSLPSPA